MARGHLFLIVVLLTAAAVAGLLAVTRTTQTTPAAAADPAITFRMKKLDRLEASLQRQIAARKKATATGQTAPILVYRRAPSPVVSAHFEGDEEAFQGEREGERDD